MAQIRAIRKRMTAVGTITRITKTMQMIATAKFTAALARAKDTRPYTDAIRNLVGEVSGAAGDYESSLFAPKIEAKKELLLVISSDRGLCGAYNGNVLRVAFNQLRDAKSQDKEIVIETAGKKAKGAVLASDGFFPFDDTVRLAASRGIKAIIQPGGSIRDKESIEACNELGMAMLTTGKRHFLH